MRLCNTQKLFTQKSISAILSSIFILILRIAESLVAAIRPMLGNLGVCIYQEQPCQAYIANLFATQSFFYAGTKACMRLISCNPVNGLIKLVFIRKLYKQ